LISHFVTLQPTSIASAHHFRLTEYNPWQASNLCILLYTKDAIGWIPMDIQASRNLFVESSGLSRKNCEKTTEYGYCVQGQRIG